MTVRLDAEDEQRLTERARREQRSEQEIVQQAIRSYLDDDEVRRIEDLEDHLALARYRLRKQRGETTYVTQAEARARLGI